ncbi:MAG: nucleoside-diphosphate sugar epimerase/dehydratase [Pirellulales bacterium]
MSVSRRESAGGQADVSERMTTNDDSSVLVHGGHDAAAQRGGGLIAPTILDWVIRYRLVLLMLGHSVTFGVAYWLAFCLRFAGGEAGQSDYVIPLEYQARMWKTMAIVILVKLVLFYALKYYHGWWRYVTFADFMALLRASGLSLLVLAGIDHFLLDFQIPRAVLLLDMIMTGILLGLFRSSWRLLREGIWPGVNLDTDRERVVMYANNHESIVLANQINSMPGAKYRVVGLVCDEAYRPGSSRAGIPIVGQPMNVRSICRIKEANELWVVAGTVSGSRLREFREICADAGVPIKIIPSRITESNSTGRVPVRNIEIRDLLRREPVELDNRAISEQLRGQRIMVTGAGGSIGSEICRQVMSFGPSDLVLLDHRENSVFLIHNELKELKSPVRLHPCVGDILDATRMRYIYEHYRPDYVYHAAAHKHVGMMEQNAGEAVKNNVFGTKNVADLAEEFGVKKFVLISTDKAVNPTSVMGASKQLAERYIHALHQQAKTAFIAVRFGNVLGSNGSVVPIFTEQIARGGPITVTDPRMTRFFMTIPEASQLVLQAASMGKGGEIFVLDMGEQVPIVELAREMVRLSGLPEDSIEIEFSGMRAGEKLYEELYFDDEKMLQTTHPKIHAAQHRRYTVPEVLKAIDELKPLLSAPNQQIRAKLKDIIPEFQWNPGTLENAVSEAN